MKGQTHPFMKDDDILVFRLPYPPLGDVQIHDPFILCGWSLSGSVRDTSCTLHDPPSYWSMDNVPGPEVSSGAVQVYEFTDPPYIVPVG